MGRIPVLCPDGKLKTPPGKIHCSVRYYIKLEKTSLSVICKKTFSLKIEGEGFFYMRIIGLLYNEM